MTHGRLTFLVRPDRYPVRPSQPYQLFLEINLLSRELPPASTSTKIRRDHSYILRPLDIVSCLLGHVNIVAPAPLANLILEACCSHWTHHVCESIFYRVYQLDRNEEESLTEGGYDSFAFVYFKRVDSAGALLSSSSRFIHRAALASVVWKSALLKSSAPKHAGAVR